MQMKKIPVNISNISVSDKYGLQVSFFFKEEDFLLNKRKILEDMVTLAVDFCGRIVSPERTSLLGEMGYFINIGFIGKSKYTAFKCFTKCLLLEDYVLVQT